MKNDFFSPSNFYTPGSSCWSTGDNPSTYATKITLRDGSVVENPYPRDEHLYFYNSNGFRSDEFTDASDARIIFLGCSVTFGDAVRKEETWSWQLIKHIERDTGKKIAYWNLGMGGAGIDTIARIFQEHKDQLKPALVFVLFPDIYRREIPVNDKFKLFLVSHVNGYSDLENEIFLDKQWATYQAQKNLLLIDYIVSSLNATILHGSWCFTQLPPNLFDESKYVNFKHLLPDYVYIDYGLDGKHPGPTSNKTYADLIYSQYKELILQSI